MQNKARRTDDQLWKSILEQTFAYFLQFFFPNAAEVYDLEKPFDYLDKEFESLFPPEPNGKGVRYVDKLIRVYLKDGGEQYVLIHVEVQSSKGRGDLAKRMFEYYYKILDKYDVPIAAIAILADKVKSYRPTGFFKEHMDTSLSYRFKSYKILDQDEEALRKDENPFAVVVLTALLALKRSNLTDDELMDIKHDLYDRMMELKMEKTTRQGIYDFLKYYVRFEDNQNMVIFEQEVKEKLGRSEPMGTQEYLLERAQKEGLAKGKLAERAVAKRLIEEERARAKAEKLAEKLDSALNFKKMGVPVQDIAKGLGLTVEEVEKL